MKAKFIFTVILFTIVTNHCHAQNSVVDSIRKYLFGEWQQISHHKGQTISFDTLMHVLTSKNPADSISYCQYTIVGDSLFVFDKDYTWEARIILRSCDQIEFEMNDDSIFHRALFRRKYRIKTDN